MRAFTKLTFRSFLFFLIGNFANADDFESYQGGSFQNLKTPVGEWTAAPGHAQIHDSHGRSGKKSLRILGGKNAQTTLKLKKATEPETLLNFWSERWTREAPFSFSVEAKTESGWQKIIQADDIKVGGFHTQISKILPAKTSELRFTASSPENRGVLIDDLTIEPATPMVFQSLTTVQPVIPALIRKKNNAVLGLKIVTEGRLNPLNVTAIEMNLTGSTNAQDISSVQIFGSASANQNKFENPFADAKKSPNSTEKPLTFTGKTPLAAGENFFWISVELDEKASLDHLIDAAVLRVQIDDGKEKQTLTPEITSPDGAQRIGYALRVHGDDGSKTYRIPGLATSKKGTLLAVYDVRYRHAGDLPADIDVGLSRSFDGGQTWDKMKVIMDMGDDPDWSYDGIGDPAVLVDEKTGRIWVAALWSHGNNSWHGSGQGLEPKDTGQLILVHSDDDGLTWSEPINITKQIKEKDWHLVLPGPGRGITLNDGTLVFAAQYQDESKHDNGKKKAFPFSTIMWSQDEGKTWHFGTGIKGNTTEAQVVQLADGSLMLNCRDNRGGSRTIGTTTDLGKTWTLHPTDREALPEPVCMASLLRMETKKHGALLFFSNPNTKSGRYNMTLKISSDEGMTWPENHHFLYDSRGGSGYSCLTDIGDHHVGVLYEGPNELYFLRFSIDELAK